MEYTFQATVYLRTSDKPSSRHFITVPQSISQEIKEQHQATHTKRRGRDSVRVRIRIAHIVWETSLFPDSKSGCYIMPIKKSIRQELNINDGSTIGLAIEIVD